MRNNSIIYSNTDVYSFNQKKYELNDVNHPIASKIKFKPNPKPYQNDVQNKCSCGGNCGSNCGGKCGCIKNFYEDEEKLIFFDDPSYAIYRLKDWKNEYKVNLLGIDNEIPATEITKNQSLKIMDEIRKYKFNFKGNEINGMVGLAIRHNNLQNKDIDWLIDVEKKEYYRICDELEKQKIENSKNYVELNNEEFLIYKLKENCHGVVLSRPVNNYTKKHSTVELSKIKLSTI